MGIKNINFRNNFFSFILILIIIIIGVISYFRFIVRHDYLVGYEGECDPTAESCFIGCNDDTCTEEYYYTKMQKYAPDLYAECGKDITDCEAADVCLPEDQKCSVTYCDSEIDGFDACTVVEDFSVLNENKEGFLEDNEMNKNI
jgi:hypothetical protein